jgi:hypothetical protein
MSLGSPREPIPPERALVLASRRDIRGSVRAWLAALSMVLGIAAASILLRTWPSQAPLRGTSWAVAVLPAPQLPPASLDPGVGRPLHVTAGARPQTGDRTVSQNPPSVVPERPATSQPKEALPTASLAVAAGHDDVTEIPHASMALVVMTEPRLEPETLTALEPETLALDSAGSDAPFAAAAPKLVGRVMVAAGRGIATGFRLTGASIRSAF